MLNKFLTQWNQSISYGLPVGASAFRLVAEVTINDVDQALAARGYRFCRYSDDFRFFVASEREGREILAFLARTLSNSHGLTLQAAKTELIPAEEFSERFRWSEQDEATGTIQENLHELLARSASTCTSSLPSPIFLKRSVKQSRKRMSGPCSEISSTRTSRTCGRSASRCSKSGGGAWPTRKADP